MAKEIQNTIKAPQFVGAVNADQVQAWKDSNGIDTVLMIKVKNKDGATSVCYLKPADRNVAALATTHMMNQRLIEAGGVFIANCWLGGDERIKTDDRLYLGACTQAAEALDIPEVSSEKL